MEVIEISVVVPVYNSEGCLEELVNQLHAALQNLNYEVILVNDLSTDNSWKKIVSLAQAHDAVNGISLKKNSGQDNAIMAGLSQTRGSYVVIMDDDLQHSPYDIKVLHNKCKEGYDICYAVFKKRQSVWKNLGSDLNGFLSWVFLKKPKNLYLSPFKMIRQDFLKEILTYQGPFPYLDGIVLSLTSNIGQVETIHHDRYRGKGNYGLYKSMSVFLKHVTGYSLYPLRLVTFTGFLASTLAIIIAAYYVLDYFTNSTHVEGWLTLVLLLVFFNGLILMCLGFIGEYIGRIYLTVSSKRPYVIDQLIKAKLPSLKKP
jgi:glycosyltransferase involved in cell wall biosynthesis